jgi:DNA-binding IclR family transcriptional regulator
LGVRCWAAGIFVYQDTLLAGLSISAPADRIEVGCMARVKDTAAQISSALGHRK